MLRIQGLTVRYPNGPRALDAVSLVIPPGTFGLLGPNGAGKSTLLRILATLQRPDAGSVQLGIGTSALIDVLAEPARLRAQLGYLPQDFGLYPTLSVEAVLDHFCALKGATDRHTRAAWVDALLSRTNLADKRRVAVRALSGGMRQRLGLAIALAGHPRLLLLDEPTAGLDPGERRRIYDLLAGVGEDVVIILSTHLTEDVRAACARFGILHAGRIVTEDTPTHALEMLRARRGPEVTLEDVYFAHVPENEDG
ncbi:ATP-binding cassette domain-containing protein [Gemmatimonas sp.]|uniref:ATP-binding cassette domain-containing protein n=1 Tax=Gemmatimonas sp. TaxID=1962908 RepID=UPI00356A792C